MKFNLISIRFIACSVPVSKVHSGWLVKGQHNGARLAVHLKNALDCLELTEGRLLGITTDNASSNYSITCELQSTLETSGSEWPALRNRIACMAHVIQLALGAFMSSLGVKGRTKSWEAHEHDQRFGDNETRDIARSQRIRKEGNARIDKVSAMRPGLAKIIEKVRISWYFECPKADLHIAENACSVNYANAWTLKQVHWLSKCWSPHGSTSDYGCEDTWELCTGVVWSRLPITGIHMQVTSKAKLQWIPATDSNSGWVDDCQVCHGSNGAISILDPLDVEEAYSQHHSVKWHVRSHGWRNASFG